MKKKYLVLIGLIYCGGLALALEKTDINGLMKSGQYSSIVRLLENQQRNRSETKILLTAYFRMQNFDRFIEMAPDYLKTQEDGETRFLLAQSYYSTQKFPESFQQFKKTEELGIHKSVSQYYQGYISYLQGDFKKAQDIFLSVARQKDDPLRTSAIFFAAESAYELAGDPPKESQLIKLNPIYQKVIDLDPKGSLVPQAKQRMSEIDQRLNPNRYRKLYSVRFSEEFRYDSNLISEAEEKTGKVGYKKAYESYSDLRARYTLPVTRFYELTPNAGYNYTYHLFTGNPEIRSYDAGSVTGSLHNKFIKDANTYGVAEYSFKYGTKDNLGQKHQDYYSKGHTGNFTATSKIFSLGESSLNAHLGIETNYNNLLDTANYGFRIDQEVNVKELFSWYPSISFDRNIARAKDYSNKKYGIFNSLVRNINTAWNASARFNYIYTNYYRISSYRRPEHNYVYGIGARWSVFPPTVALSADATYTINKSPLKALYEYQKFVGKIGLTASF